MIQLGEWYVHNMSNRQYQAAIILTDSCINKQPSSEYVCHGPVVSHPGVYTGSPPSHGSELHPVGDSTSPRRGSFIVECPTRNCAMADARDGKRRAGCFCQVTQRARLRARWIFGKDISSGKKSAMSVPFHEHWRRLLLVRFFIAAENNIWDYAPRFSNTTNRLEHSAAVLCILSAVVHINTW